ncbi:hypothetical protein KO516_21465 [Citreicella sp. C3M06]|uniref:hypothetical protein n=1 Tax=Citreicella sp. C3M06 TaxID=2841564 RepID=UPI001C082B77|nr:hypothetical protein [Citreicella sp. C3M06]MBU2963345.1 hypothetical protein [Citreicella sp. C3M06]
MTVWKPNAWRMANVHSGMTRAELDAFVAQAKDQGYIDGKAIFGRKSDCVAALHRARQLAANAVHVAVSATPKAAASLCEIPAAEVNAWLRSLPPEGLDP